MSPKRHRVATRPKVRGRRLRRAVVGVTLLALGAAAVVVVRAVIRGLPRLPEAGGPVVVEGAPEALQSELTRWLEAHPAAASDDLLKAFPALAYVQEGRSSWRVVPRRPVARTAGGALLADDGVLFRPYPGLELPAVEADVAKAGDAERKALADFLAQSPLAVARMKYVSADEGWEAALADGTRVLWGGLKYTRQKAERLTQALDDARARQPGDFLADLRYFEDGRILLRRP